jgi:CBS domain-containing protein
MLSCDPSTPLVTVAQRLDDAGVHAIVVLSSADESGRRPSGLITDLVVLRHAEDADRFTAGEVASRDVLEVFPDEPLRTVVRRMASHAVTHVVVLDAPSGHPIGVLAASDVVRVLAWGRM